MMMLNRCVREPDTECWLWTGATANGYPHVMAGQAHRVLYEVLVGPIPDGHDLHHTCFVPLCMNPAHLVPMTRAEHVALHRPLALVCRNGHRIEGGNLIVRADRGRRCRVCANELARANYHRRRAEP